MNGEVTVERLERGLAILAYCMELDGPIVAPLFEKLELELASLRAREDTVARAKSLLPNFATSSVPLLAAPQPAAPLPRYVERNADGGLAFRERTDSLAALLCRPIRRRLNFVAHIVRHWSKP
jgi:hypothetical protein